MPNIPQDFIGQLVVSGMDILSYRAIKCPRCGEVATGIKDSDDFVECRKCEYRMEFFFCQADPDLCDRRAQVVVRTECLQPAALQRFFLCADCYAKRPIFLGEKMSFTRGAEAQNE